MVRKYVTFVLSLLVCLSLLAPNVSASIDPNFAEKRKQEQLDNLFTRLNESITSRKMLEHLAEKTKSQSVVINSGEKITVNTFRSEISKLEELESDIENEILKLGVKKIDPQNKADLALVTELLNSSPRPNYVQSSIPDPPDLSAVASLYTLYHYRGTYTYQGVTYDYAYIRVIDNKGYNKLYKLQIFNALPSNATNAMILGFLQHQFSYVFSTLLSSVPYGIAVDWTISSAIATMSNYNTSLMTGTSDPFYWIVVNSTTEMTYYWIYTGTSWKLLGSDGKFSLTKGDYAAFNYQGQPKQEPAIQPTWTSTSGYPWYKYIENYHYNPTFEQINYLGSFNIKSKHTSFNVNYSPVFIHYPGYLV